MSECQTQLLSALVDDELPNPDRRRLLEHLRQCPACASEFERLHAMAGAIRGYSFADITSGELESLHQAIDDSADQPILRLGWMLSAAAASILIIGSAWLWEIPSSSPADLIQTAQLPQQPWEQTAVTLKPRFVMEAPDTGNGDVQMARADMTQWMVQELKTSSKLP